MDVGLPEISYDEAMDRERLELILQQTLLANPKQTNLRWYVQYQRAKLWVKDNSALSCKLWLDLSKEPQFPLRKVSLLRATDTCPTATAIDVPPISAVEPWLRSSAVDIFLKRAENEKNSKKIIDLSVEKSKSVPLQKDKITKLNRALELAKVAGNTKQLKDIQNRLYRVAPRLKPNPRPSDYLNVAYDFRRARQFEESKTYFNKIIKGKHFSFTEKVQALRGLRAVFRLQNKKPEYLEASERLSKFVNKAFKSNKQDPAFLKTYHDVELEVIRTFWTHGQIKKAKAGLLALTQKLNTLYPLTEAHWLRGRMEEETKDFAKAITWYDQALSQPTGDSSRERLLWYKAWNLRKIHRVAEAADLLAELKSTTTDESARNRYSYWLATSYSETGKTGIASDEFKRLTLSDPYGYYGLLAHRALNLPITVAHDTPAVSSKSILGEHMDKNTLEWLLRLGEKEFATNYLNGVAETLKKLPPSLSNDTWVDLFQGYLRTGDFVSLYEQLSALPSDQRTALLDTHPQFVFPKPYQDVVTSSASQFGVSSDLIYSIMRQESAFNPKARSPADAFGLMQLLPEVAARSSRGTHIQIRDAEDLFEPTVNIPLGSAHLRELWNRHQGQFVLLVASYNASEDAIKNWLNTRWRGSTVEFIEDIPYEETRSYVRLVMRNLVFYSALENRGLPTPFPEWVLDIHPPQT